MKAVRSVLAILACASAIGSRAWAEELAGASLRVVHTSVAGGFSLTSADAAADLCVSDNDYEVAKIATNLLANDIHDVSDRTPAVRNGTDALSAQAVVIGTIGHSAVVDGLIASGKLNVQELKGAWESYKIAVVENPMPQVARALVIAGSDRRGTAYGVLDLSERIGVSPWHWWADVPPEHQQVLTIEPGSVREGPPSVQYRGIFINDEDWGMEPWAAKTFDPQQGNIGPKTYEKVFELLLRLKANLLWPAMHPVSTEFGKIAENSALADKWGIVMGASHAEPMNRNNVLWKDENKGEWNFATNRTNIDAYWEEWAKLRGKYEAVWTVGIRGIHDSAMLGPKDPDARVKIVEDAIADQRALLAKYVNPDVEKVPQVFMPYKEVLSLYQRGMKLPDDISIMWTDDNYGYIRQLSNDAEQKRSGGGGVYYHISYLGDPRSYTWLNTTPPALIWEEMSKAYAYNARRMWVVNVGDIKPGEIGMDFWAHLGWNIHAYDHITIRNYVRDFAARTFGESQAEAIADVLREYYLLGFQRKPEAMDSEPFSISDYNEAGDRLAAYQAILKRAEEIDSQLSPEQRDAFYELVLYPVRASTLANEICIDNALGQSLAKDQPAESARYTVAAAQALEELHAATDYYNTQLAGGKWNHIMTEKGTTSSRWGFSWPKLPAASGNAVGETGTLAAATAPAAGVPAVPRTRSFVERDGVVSMDAGNFTRNTPQEGAAWNVIEGLGRTGKAICVLPFNTPPSNVSDKNDLAAPAVEYDFTTSRDGDADLTAFALPTHRIHDGMEVRFAIAVDNETPQILNISTDGGDEHNKEWQKNVLRNAAVVSSHHHLAAAGAHTLKVWMVDPGVVLDKFVLSFGEVKPSYLGPSETVGE